MCELCDLTQDKEKREKITAHNEEVIDVFHFFLNPTIEKYHLIFIMLRFLVQWSVGRL